MSLFTRRIPLAWLNLTHDWRRLAVSVAGIAFAVFLMFIEMGFKHALIDSTVEVVNLMDGDLIMASAAKFAMPTRQRFVRPRLFQARSVAGVTGAYPVYVESMYGVVKKVNEHGYPIRVVGFHLNDPVFRQELLEEYIAQLRLPDTGVIDSKSKRKYGLQAESDAALKDYAVELSNRSLRLVGSFELGTDFANDGNVLMSAENYARYFSFGGGGAPLDEVDLGVIHADDALSDADLLDLRDELKATLPGDVAVYTREEFMQRERNFWNSATPVGYIFTVGMIMGFIVGVIICYQIIFTDIADHMGELATLKAMGYRNRFFVRMVIVQSVYLSIFGFIPGFLISLGVYNLLASWTGLLLRMTFGRALFVFVLTTVMCVVSGCLAVRKILSTDPAELF